jgi:predicted acyl esterase
VAAQQSDIPKTFAVPTAGYDYVKREVMIPMRDGVKLHTVIVVPKDAKNAPILLTRTPYNASARTSRNTSPHMLAALPQADEVFVQDGYIRVFQDVRGKYESEGEYLMTRPARGPLNPTTTDHSTDAYDTIDWLVKNTPESNGRVGMIGSSYEGFTVVMALLGPHPALNPRAPWWMAGWATTGSTTAHSAKPISTTSPTRQLRKPKARPFPAMSMTTTKPSAAPVRPAPTPACTASISCPGCRR